MLEEIRQLRFVVLDLQRDPCFLDLRPSCSEDNSCTAYAVLVSLVCRH
jgi:hypothetical protein